MPSRHRGWGATTPPFGWLADPRAVHDLSMRAALIFNSPGGSKVWDSISPDRLSITTTGLANPSVGLGGPCFRFPGSSCYNYGNATHLNFGANDFTLMALASTTVTVTEMGLINKATSAAGFPGYWLGVGSVTANVGYFSFNTSGTAAEADGTTNITDGKPRLFTGVRRGGTVAEFWLNDDLEKSTSGGSGTSVDVTNGYLVGADVSSAMADFWSGNIYMALAFGRALTPDEIRRFYLEPYWWVAQPPSRLKSFSTGSVSYNLSATAGSFALTGLAAGLAAARTITASAGSFALTGQDAAMKVAMPASAGAFTLTGQAAGLIAARNMTAGLGSFSETGQAATFGVTMPAGVGVFALTGQVTSLTATRRLTAGIGSFALTGVAAGVTAARLTAASPGSFVVTGRDAGFGLTVPAGSGPFVVTGAAAGLVTARALPALAGSFVVAGQAAGLLVTRLLVTSSGVFSLTGKAAGMAQGKGMTASSASFALSGQAAAFTLTHRLAATPGSLALGGGETGLSAARAMAVDVGSFALAGGAAVLARGLTLAAAQSPFAVTGQGAGMTLGRVMPAGLGSFVVTGSPATLTSSASGVPPVTVFWSTSAVESDVPWSSSEVSVSWSTSTAEVSWSTSAVEQDIGWSGSGDVATINWSL